MRHPARLLLVAGVATWLALPASAQYPCSFAWNSLKATNGSTYSFTPPAVGQPYQGPCEAFATVAAMESMYKLEHANPWASPNLSIAWIDYLTWGTSDWKLYLETQNRGVPTQACGNFAPYCTNEPNQCNLQSTVKPITQAGNCYPFVKDVPGIVRSD